MLGTQRLLVLAIAAWAMVAIATEARATSAAKGTATERQTIEKLITAVENLKNAVFVRNGRAYRPATAGKFLRGKWDQQSRNVHSADDFITKVATRSSTTQRVCLVRFSDGREIELATFLRSELQKMR